MKTPLSLALGPDAADHTVSISNVDPGTASETVTAAASGRGGAAVTVATLPRMGCE